MLSLRAHAKVNLGLSVLGRRPDGFHEVDTLLARVALHDTLTLTPQASGISLEVSGADLGIPPEQNLAYRAAARYLAALEEPRGIALALEKRIPAAAGLGGGSADAGAVLRGLAELYPAELDVLALAAQLGSDVPFFAAGWSAARATGRGEVLSVLSVPECHIVLVNPGVGVSAADAYRHLQRATPPLEPEALLARLSRHEEPGYSNALQAGVLRLEPVVGEVLAALHDTALTGVLMSGSGSSCFGLAGSRSEAERVVAHLKAEHPGWWVGTTRTL